MSAPSGDFLARVLADSTTEAMYHLEVPLLAEVRAISDTHTADVLNAAGRGDVLHTEPVPGCAWCITEAQAAVMHELLESVRPFGDDYWENPPRRSARLMLAVLDLNTRPLA